MNTDPGVIFLATVGATTLVALSFLATAYFVHFLQTFKIVRKTPEEIKKDRYA